MESVTLGQIAGAISLISVFIAFIKLLKNAWDNNVTNKIEANSDSIAQIKSQTSESIKEIKTRVKKVEDEVDDSKEERLILLQGLLSCLKGLKEQGCDGAVADSITKIEEYLIKKSH